LLGFAGSNPGLELIRFHLVLLAFEVVAAESTDVRDFVLYVL
jgi:hypothetical protein